MPTKKTIEVQAYTITAPFMLDGKEYKAGQDWVMPDGWQEATDPVSERRMFVEPYSMTYINEKGKQVTDTFTRNHFLPVN